MPTTPLLLLLIIIIGSKEKHFIYYMRLFAWHLSWYLGTPVVAWYLMNILGSLSLRYLSLFLNKLNHGNHFPLKMKMNFVKLNS